MTTIFFSCVRDYKMILRSVHCCSSKCQKREVVVRVILCPFVPSLNWRTEKRTGHVAGC